MEPPAVMEMSEMQRRQFLRAAGVGAGMLLSARLPTSKTDFLGSEYLDHAASELAQLHTVDDRYGAVGVAMMASDLAERLFLQLKITASSEPLRRRLALLAGQAADLAGWTALHLGEAKTALTWSHVQLACAEQANSPDLIGWALRDQAMLLDAAGEYDAAMGCLQRAPTDGMSAPVLAKVEEMRAEVAAASNYPLRDRERWALSALDRAQTAAQRVTADPSELGWTWWITEHDIMSGRGRTCIVLGRHDDAFDLLDASLRNTSSKLRRASGQKHLWLARAAAGMGEIEQACTHATKAHQVFTETGTVRQTGRLRAFRESDLAPYADARAVRDLDERLRETPAPTSTVAVAGAQPTRPKRNRRRYVKVLTRDRIWKLRTAECRDGLKAKRRHPFTPAEGRRPERLAANPALRPGLVPCERCIGPLWT